MKAGVFYAKNDLRVEEMPKPLPKAGILSLIQPLVSDYLYFTGVPCRGDSRIARMAEPAVSSFSHFLGRGAKQLLSTR